MQAHLQQASMSEAEAAEFLHICRSLATTVGDRQQVQPPLSAA